MQLLPCSMQKPAPRTQNDQLNEMFLTEAIFPKPDAASLLLLLLLTTLLAFALPPSRLCPAAEEGLRPNEPARLPALLLVLLATELLLGSLKPAAVSAAANPASAAAYSGTTAHACMTCVSGCQHILHAARVSGTHFWRSVM
jgi:hypothetical protein